MRKIIIIVLVLLVVAGGGAGGLVMLGVVRNPFKPPPPAKLDAVAQAAADADAKAKANAFQMPTAALPIVKVGDILVPVITVDGAQRQVFVTCRLVTDAPSKARVTAEVSRYIDAVLSDLIPYFQVYYRTHDLIDLGILKKKLDAHAHSLFGDDVKEVLLINVFESGSGPGASNIPQGSD